MSRASIVIPTRDRLPYLEVTLRSVGPQAQDAGAEILVVDDAGPSPRARASSPSASAPAMSPTGGRSA